MSEAPQLQRILIVEDEDNARKGYEALLRKWNWTILGVGSGEEALAKFQEFQPDLILADVELPGMNGLDLLKQLGDEILRIPVIIINDEQHILEGRIEFRDMAKAFHLR